jgi:aminoglycoside phosphotransferase (APT) family kinase protein
MARHSISTRGRVSQFQASRADPSAAARHLAFAPGRWGEPDATFPYPWSCTNGSTGCPRRPRIDDVGEFATALAGFLNSLRGIDAPGGPPPGQHNFFRGGPLATYEAEALEAIDTLGAEIRAEDVKRVWTDAMATSWERAPVWVHGDVAAGNLLVRDGRLAAVLDFGSSGVGDPACDASSSPGRSCPGRAATASAPRSRSMRLRGRAGAAGRCGRR